MKFSRKAAAAASSSSSSTNKRYFNCFRELKSFFFITLAPVLLIFFLATSGLRRSGRNTYTNSSSMGTTVSTKKTAVATVDNHDANNDSNLPNIIYKNIPLKGEKDVLRYAAMEEVPSSSSTSTAGAVDGKGPDGTNQKGMILRPISIYRWAELMTHENHDYSNQLIMNFTQILKSCPYDGFRFETKGTSYYNAKEKSFEFVLVNDSYLYNFASVPDFHAFQDYFPTKATTKATSKTTTKELQNKNNNIHHGDDYDYATVFPNIGHNAILIAPIPQTNGCVTGTGTGTNNEQCYGHIGSFVRYGTTGQIISTWKVAIETFLERISLSTSTKKSSSSSSLSSTKSTVWFSTAGTGIAYLHFRLDDRPKYYNYQPFAKET